MKKAWVYRRKNIKGWWVGWYGGGKKKTKALASKALAKHFCHIKYTQLNSDVFTGIVSADWHQTVEDLSPKRWERIRKLVRLPELKFHDL